MKLVLVLIGLDFRCINLFSWDKSCVCSMIAGNTWWQSMHWTEKLSKKTTPWGLAHLSPGLFHNFIFHFIQQRMINFNFEYIVWKEIDSTKECAPFFLCHVISSAPSGEIRGTYWIWSTSNRADNMLLYYVFLFCMYNSKVNLFSFYSCGVVDLANWASVPACASMCLSISLNFMNFIAIS